MNKGQRQIIAEKVASTVRVLELLRFEYEVSRPKSERKRGNKSPRVVYVYARTPHSPENLRLRVYNSADGQTWANKADGAPVDVGSIEELYDYLRRHPARLRLKSRR